MSKNSGKKLPVSENKGQLLVYPSASDVADCDWDWPNFTPHEMRCKGSGKVGVCWDSMDKLQALRHDLDEPMIITSAYRSPAHNKSQGGARRSQHLKGKAFDVQMHGHDPVVFEAKARAAGFTSIGYYVDDGFMHIDTRKSGKTWGEPFPATWGQPEVPTLKRRWRR
jgi:uncharacterized protein YcbK (DUF882 family)